MNQLTSPNEPTDGELPSGVSQAGVETVERPEWAEKALANRTSA